MSAQCEASKGGKFCCLTPWRLCRPARLPDPALFRKSLMYIGSFLHGGWPGTGAESVPSTKLRGRQSGPSARPHFEAILEMMQIPRSFPPLTPAPIPMPGAPATEAKAPATSDMAVPFSVDAQRPFWSNQHCS